MPGSRPTKRNAPWTTKAIRETHAHQRGLHRRLIRAVPIEKHHLTESRA
jgi:hypothetical protein